MIIDGRAIAKAIITETKAEVENLPYTPRLAVFTCSPNFETQKFLALKQRKAAEVGIALQLIEFDSEVTVPEIVLSLNQAHLFADGIVVQLPFPKRIDINEILPAVLPTHDVDVLTYDGSLEAPLPPVVGAINEIIERYKIDIKDKQIAVIGRGRLVGSPAALYAKAKGAAKVVVLDKSDTDIDKELQSADVIISGTGAAGLITADKIKAGAVVFDAGTSESEGVLVGDAKPEVADKASFFTPVPGGIGPITVAVLLKNLLVLAKKHRK